MPSKPSVTSSFEYAVDIVEREIRESAPILTTMDLDELAVKIVTKMQWEGLRLPRAWAAKGQLLRGWKEVQEINAQQD